MDNNVNKRTFLNLDFVQGEGIKLEFSVTEDCVQVSLDEYLLEGSIKESFNDLPIAVFSFMESEDDPDYWVASMSSLITTSLAPAKYTYEIRMTSLMGEPDTLLYGTLTIRSTRI